MGSVQAKTVPHKTDYFELEVKSQVEGWYSNIDVLERLERIQSCGDSRQYHTQRYYK